MMSATSLERGNPQTTAPADFGGEGSAEDIAAALAAMDDPAPESGPDSETETETSDDLSQEPDSAGAEDTGDIDSASDPDDESDETADAEGEPEAEAEEDSAEAKGTPGEQKRISKLTGKLHEAERELEARETELTSLRAELEELRENGPGNAPPLTDNAVDRHPEVLDLGRQAEQQRALRDALEAELARMEDEADDTGSLALAEGRSLPLTRARAKDLIRESDAIIHRLEMRETVVRDRVALAVQAEQRQFSAVAREAYPWLADKQSDQSKAIREVMRQYPFLKSVPSHELDLADLLAGRQARMEREAAAKAAAKSKPEAAKPKATVRPPRATTTPVRRELSRQERMRNQMASVQTGSVDEIAALIPD